MGTPLSVPELFKYSWRIDKFIQKYQDKEPFTLLSNQKVVLAYSEETLKTLKKKKSDDYRKLEFSDSKVKTRKYKFTSFLKDEDFGGKPAGKMAAGIEDEMKAVENINSQLAEIKGKTGKKIVKIKIGTHSYNVAKATKVAGTVKSDLALLDESGGEVVWISYKKGNRAKDFQQWGGMTEPIIQNHKEVQTFIKQLQDKFGEVMPNATTIAKKIKDAKLKKYAVYGINFDIAGRGLGQQNVSIVLQGDIKLKKDGVGYELNSEHVLENGEAITGDYEPVLMAIYKGDRSQFGLKGARFVIQPRASRAVTEWIE